MATRKMLSPGAALTVMIVLIAAGAVYSARFAAAACSPLETREANASDQRPAFPGQTRACAITSNVAFDVVVLATGLVEPWAVEPLSSGELLVTEKPGRLRIVTANGVLGEPISGVPGVDARGQGGLLDVALSPAFDTDRTIYLSYAEPREGGNGTSVARAVLSADRRSLEQVSVIFPFARCRLTTATSITARVSPSVRTGCCT